MKNYRGDGMPILDQIEGEALDLSFIETLVVIRGPWRDG